MRVSILISTFETLYFYFTSNFQTFPMILLISCNFLYNTIISALIIFPYIKCFFESNHLSYNTKSLCYSTVQWIYTCFITSPPLSHIDLMNDVKFFLSYFLATLLKTQFVLALYILRVWTHIIE